MEIAPGETFLHRKITLTTGMLGHVSQINTHRISIYKLIVRNEDRQDIVSSLTPSPLKGKSIIVCWRRRKK